MAKMKEFAVIIPFTKQISQDEYKCYYKIKIFNQEQRIDYVLEECKKLKSDLAIEDLSFAEIIKE